MHNIFLVYLGTCTVTVGTVNYFAGLIKHWASIVASTCSFLAHPAFTRGSHSRVACRSICEQNQVINVVFRSWSRDKKLQRSMNQWYFSESKAMWLELVFCTSANQRIKSFGREWSNNYCSHIWLSGWYLNEYPLKLHGANHGDEEEVCE